MLACVPPLLQVPPLFPDKVTEPPLQNVVAPPAVIIGVTGNGFTVTSMLFDAVLPHEFVVVTE